MLCWVDRIYVRYKSKLKVLYNQSVSEFLVLGGLALADAINPTTLGISLYLLMHRHYLQQVLLFVCGVFVTYFFFGLVLELGFDKFLLGLWGEQHSALTALNLLIGTAIILYGFRLGKRPKKRRASLQKQSVVTVHSAFVLGGLATVMDLPTAFPYLGLSALSGP